MEQFDGIGVSAGVAIGRVFVLHSGDTFSIPKKEIGEDHVPSEIERFENVIQETREEIMKVRRRVFEQIGRENAEIFTAHIMILEDSTMIEDVQEIIKQEHVVAEYAFSKVLRKYFQAFAQADDSYLKERISDIRDVGRRLLSNLCGEERSKLDDIDEKIIIVSRDLSPSDTASLDRKKVLGFVTEIGGPTSHTAILGRSLEIPAIVGMNKILKKVKNGDTLIVDGSHGVAIVNPDAEAIREYEDKQKQFVTIRTELDKLKDLPAQTPDGRRVTLAANIEFHYELGSVVSHGADGIGLYRTEYFYMNRADLPDEEEQFQAYKQVAEQMQSKAVVVRTLDLGGDKFASSFELPHEMNPYLGWRAIRFCLERKQIFKIQLRAILRASVFGCLKIMYPLISNVDEIKKANLILDECRKELDAEGVPYDKSLEVGAMIEVPSAAITSDVMAREVDFFSIGTNDLIQYSLAVDRVNEKIAYLYQPTHPAILRLIKTVVENGHSHGKWVGSCGEMAGDPAVAMFLLGLEIDEISASPVMLPKIKNVIRSINFKDAKKIAAQALSLDTASEIKEFLDQKLKFHCKDVMGI